MTSKLSRFLLVDSSVASPSSARRTVLTQQAEVTTERHPGTVPSKHTFVKTSVLSTGIMTRRTRCVEKKITNCEISRKNYKL